MCLHLHLGSIQDEAGQQAGLAEGQGERPRAGADPRQHISVLITPDIRPRDLSTCSRQRAHVSSTVNIPCRGD